MKFSNLSSMREIEINFVMATVTEPFFDELSLKSAEIINCNLAKQDLFSSYLKGVVKDVKEKLNSPDFIVPDLSPLENNETNAVHRISRKSRGGGKISVKKYSNKNIRGSKTPAKPSRTSGRISNGSHQEMPPPRLDVPDGKTPTSAKLNKTINLMKSDDLENAPKAIMSPVQKFLNENSVKEHQNSASTPSNADASILTYEISILRASDDEGDSDPRTKPVPKWANGLRLRDTLLKQIYNPPDSDLLHIEIRMDQDEMFGLKKKKVLRSSSAIWDTPDRPKL